MFTGIFNVGGEKNRMGSRAIRSRGEGKGSREKGWEAEKKRKAGR